jgi:hypothetical protein
MGKPLSKDPDGGRFEILWEWKASLKVNASGVKNVRASQSEGSPRSLSDRLTHVRVDKFLCNI